MTPREPRFYKMSDYKDIFRSVESQNWFKSCLAVLIAKEGIVEFVKNEIDTFQQDCLQKVYQVNNVPQGTKCTSCTTRSVVPCRPNRGICQIRRGRCTFHTGPQKSCPNNICDFLRQQIEKEHHYNGPSWKNSDCQSWCGNAWELAKCFMPPDGYPNTPSAEATDFNGIISVMINCKRFENKLDDDLSKDTNLCTKAREVGRSIRHCADLKMTTVSMTQNISTLIDLLRDAKYLKTDIKASEAMLKLIQLKTDLLTITNVDIKAALDSLQDEMIKQAADKTQNTMEQVMSKKLQELTERIKELELENMRKMTESGKLHLDQLKQGGESAVTDFTTTINEKLVIAKKDLGTEKDRLVAAGAVVMSDLKTEIKEEVEEAKKQLKMAGEAAVSDIKEELVEAKTELDIEKERLVKGGESAVTAFTTNINKKLVTAKKDLGTEKDRLVAAGAAVISDLKAEIKEEVEEAKKELKMAGEAAVSDIKEELVAAKTELEVEKERLVKDIGMRRNETVDEIYESKKQALRQALMEHYLTRQCTMPISPLMPEVDEQLNKFYMPFNMHKVDTKSTTKSETPPQILDMYKSIFYDGNISHSNIYIQGEAGIGKSTFCTKLALTWSENIGKEIPVEPKQNKGQIFTDETIIKEFNFVFSLALRDVEGACEIEDMIEIQIISELPDHSKYAGLVPTILDKEHCLIILDGLDEWWHQRNTCKKSGLIPHRKSWSKTTMLTLTRPWKINEVRLRDSEVSVLIQISGITDSKTFIRNVLKCLNDKYNTMLNVGDFFDYMADKKFEHFLEIPVVAMQLLWLWHSGHALGNSKCQIYINMLDMLFGRAEKSSSVCDDIADNPKAGLPPCFESTTFCEQHEMLLDYLGSLAFHTLYSGKREESLVFSESIVKKHVKYNTALKTALTTGILSQHKSPSRIARRSHFSFMHKTFQEFFAAYYIATHADESKNIVPTLFQVYGQAVDIMEISELFIFVCGLNTEMSSRISDSVMKSFSVKLTNHIEELQVSGGFYEVEEMTRSLQKMILAGYKESISNGHNDPQLALHYVDYNKYHISGDDKINQDRLVDRNINQIVSLSSYDSSVDVVKIQQILTQSSCTLSYVSLNADACLTGACLDLFTNMTLKSLDLSWIRNHLEIKLNASSLLYCGLWEINREVEHSVLSALTAAPQLHTLEVTDCKNMHVLYQVLPTLPMLHKLVVLSDRGYIVPASLCRVLSTLSQLQSLTLYGEVCEAPSLLCQTPSTISNLKYIRLGRTDLGDNDILLPNSIQEILLLDVDLTCRSVRQLVDRLAQIPHQVTCELLGCTVRPVTEWDTIVKDVQQSAIFEINNRYSGIGSFSVTKIQT